MEKTMMSIAAITLGLYAFAANLDEGVWPSVVPEFKTPSPRIVKGAYFKGRLIKSPKSNCADGVQEYVFRRSVYLKAKPVEAWVQFIGIGSARLRLNGEVAARNGDWMHPTVAEIGGRLVEGRNEIDFVYPWRKSPKRGVLAELFIRYQDGSHERIDTDSSFRVSGDGGKTWDDVVEQLPPPAKPFPFVRRLSYVDFANLQKFVSGSVEPGEVVAGSRVKARFQFKGPLPLAPLDVGVTVSRNGGEFWHEDVALGGECIKAGKDGGWTLDLPFSLPLYLSDGEYDLVVSSGLSCVSGAVAKAAFTCRRAAPIKGFEKRVHADVRMVAGAPQFHIDGEPFFALWGGVAQRARHDRTPRHSSAPLSVVTVYSRSYDSRDEWWLSEDGFDPAVFDRQAEMYRRANGDGAYFMWNLTLYPPQDWIAKHPGEMCVDDKGERVSDGASVFSFASKAAIDAMERAMVKAIRYLEFSPYANRIIGYRITSGHTIEWLGWDAPRGREVDFSPATEKAFSEYVKANHLELGDSRIPSPEERASSDPASRAKTAAYYDFYSRAVADDIIRLARKAREVAGAGKLIGAYYGYSMTMHATGRSQMRAHYALKHLLDAKAVDFLMSPQPYQVRRLGDTCGEMKPFATLAANGVVPVIEDDTRTHNGPYNGNNWQTHTLEQTIGIVRRNAGVALCRHEPVFFFALCEGTEFDYPEFTDDMAKIRKLGERCLANKTPRNAEVAYVISEEAIKATPAMKVKSRAAGFSMQRYNPDGSVSVEDAACLPGFTDVFRFNYTTLARAGAPVDFVLAEDLAEHPGRYKLYIEPDIVAGKMRFKAASGVTEGDTFLKADTLRDIYARAGVHVYSATDDPMEADGSIFTLHARFAGRKTVTLPKRTTVLDVFNRRVVAKDADKFSFDAPLHSSWLFYFGDDAERVLEDIAR